MMKNFAASPAQESKSGSCATIQRWSRVYTVPVTVKNTKMRGKGKARFCVTERIPGAKGFGSVRMHGCFSSKADANERAAAVGKGGGKRKSPKRKSKKRKSRR